LSPSQKAAQRYRLKRAAMTPEQIAASNAHARALARKRRRRDPEGYRAKFRAIKVRYRRRKNDLLWGFSKSQSDRIALKRPLPECH
jgi:hypothetical protein